jgi:hypothetical protein
MKGEQILILCAAISFLIGALAPALFVPPVSPRSINWLCLGFSFLAFPLFLNNKLP